jgi:hypothetical protein
MGDEMSATWYGMAFLSAGIVGAFLSIYAVARAKERQRRDRLWDMVERQMRLPRLAVALMLMGALCVPAWAQDAGSSIGKVCFRMLSFDDTIALDVVQFNLPEGVPSFFSFGVHWEGRTPQGVLVYAMDGGGSAVFNLISGGDSVLDPPVGVFSIDAVVRNTTIFFMDQRICHLRGTTDATLTGQWSLICTGKVPPTQGGTPYLVQGTLLRINCAPGVNISPLTGASITSTGMLAGVE